MEAPRTASLSPGRSLVSAEGSTRSARGIALLVVHINSFFGELFRLSLILHRRNSYRPVFVLYPYPTRDRDVQKALHANIECLEQESDGAVGDPIARSPGKGDPDRIRSAAPRIVRFLGALASRINRRLGRFFVFGLLDQLLGFSRSTYRVRKLIDTWNPSIVILGGDMTGYDTSVFVKVSHERGVPVAIVPSTMSNGLEQAEVYYGDPAHHVDDPWSRLCARMFPRWTMAYKGRTLLREPPSRAVAMELCGLAPPLPWIFNSGYADAVAIESEAMRRYYLDAGLPERQLVVTGSPADDVLAHALRNRAGLRSRLCNTLGLPSGLPIILIALPPDFLYLPGGRPECDFQSYEELVNFWIVTLDSIEGFNKIVCLHPSVAPGSMKHIERGTVRIATDPTVELVPLCDIYVASISSTIRWAIACGKPVVNYDVYRYRYTDYRSVPGVITIEEKDNFVAALRRFATDRQYLEQTARKQAEVAPMWGRLDGCSEDRLHALVDRLIASEPSRPNVSARAL